MRLGPVFAQRSFDRDDPDVGLCVRALAAGVERCGRSLELLAGHAPGPPTLLVDEPTMDMLFPPRPLPQQLQRYGIDPVPGAAFTAFGVCAHVSPLRAARLSSEFDVAPPTGARVVALCPIRLAKTATRLGFDRSDHARLVEVVWLHELLHWAHGAVSGLHTGNRAEESMVQIVLAQLLRPHPEGRALRQVMDTLARPQPTEYRAHLDLECLPTAEAERTTVPVASAEGGALGLSNEEFAARMKARRQPQS